MNKCYSLVWFKTGNDWLGYWGKHMKANCFKSVRDYQKVREARTWFIKSSTVTEFVNTCITFLTLVQQVNHFPGTFQIGRKDRLWRNLSKMMVHHGKKVSPVWHVVTDLPPFSNSKVWNFYPGSARIFEDSITISNNFWSCPKISEDVPNNLEVLRKMIMLYTDLQKSEISGKVFSFTHFTWIFHFSYWFE